MLTKWFLDCDLEQRTLCEAIVENGYIELLEEPPTTKTYVSPRAAGQCYYRGMSNGERCPPCCGLSLCCWFFHAQFFQQITAKQTGNDTRKNGYKRNWMVLVVYNQLFYYSKTAIKGVRHADDGRKSIVDGARRKSPLVSCRAGWTAYGIQWTGGINNFATPPILPRNKTILITDWKSVINIYPDVSYIQNVDLLVFSKSENFFSKIVTEIIFYVSCNQKVTHKKRTIFCCKNCCIFMLQKYIFFLI